MRTTNQLRNFYMWCIVTTLTLLVIPRSGGAQQSLQEMLERDSVIVTAQTVGSAKRAQGVGLIDAPPDTVWQVLRDYDHFADFMPRIVHSKVSESKGDTVVVAFAYDMPPPFSDIHYTLALVHRPAERRIDWTLVSGDLNASEGSWVLEPYGEKTKATYTVFIVPRLPVPQFIVNAITERSLPDVFQAVRKRAMGVKRKGVKD